MTIDDTLAFVKEVIEQASEIEEITSQKSYVNISDTGEVELRVFLRAREKFANTTWVVSSNNNYTDEQYRKVKARDGIRSLVATINGRKK